MPRIEQMPNGTYVKTLTYLEKSLIARLYQEISERKQDVENLTGRIVKVEESLLALKVKTDEHQARLGELEKKMNKLFGGSEAVIDRPLRVFGVVEAPFFRSTRTDGPPLEVASSMLVRKLNAEFLQGKTPSDFVPAEHRGKGGTEEHPLVNETTAGFMSPEEHIKLKAFQDASAYALKSDQDQLAQTVSDHIGSGGDAHALATPSQHGFMSAEDKAYLDSLPSQLAAMQSEAQNSYVKKSGDQMTGDLEFTTPDKGIVWSENGTPQVSIVRTGNQLRFSGQSVFQDTVDAPLVITQNLVADNITFKGMGIDHVRLVSVGLDSTRNDEAACYFNGQLLVPTGNTTNKNTRGSCRGWNVACFDRATRQILWVRGYDTHQDTGKTTAKSELNRLVNDLNSLDHTKVVLIWTWDQPSFEKATVTYTQSELDSAYRALIRCGASQVVKNMKYRASYALIGIPTIGEGNGMEMYNYPDPVEMSTLLIGGTPIGTMGLSGGMKNTPDPMTFQGVVNTSSIPDRSTHTQTIVPNPPTGFPVQRATVDILSLNGSLLGSFNLDNNTPSISTSIIYPDSSHTRLIRVSFTGDRMGVSIISENACYALGATGVRHPIIYRYRVTLYFS